MEHLRLISDFNVDVFAGCLRNTPGLEQAQIGVAPFGQVFQSLAAPQADAAIHETVVVWTRPEAIFESYRRALDFQSVDHEEVLAEVDRYTDVVRTRAERSRFLFHATWTLPSGHRGYGMLDYARGVGLSHLLARMNLRLSDRLGDLPNFFLLDAERWLRQAGPRPSIPKMWFASKVPFKNAVFQSAAQDIAAALEGLQGRSRKLLIVDLDETLWGGIVGETGWQGIQLGGHDHVGEAFVEFQRALKALTARGVQLAIVSKNDESVALEAIDLHPEMQLRRRDFAGWRINWSDKAANITALVEELRLGLDSVVFIDDNPVERGRIREAFAGRVSVPDWPQDPAEFSTALLGLRCFDTPAVSAEDRARAAMYADERERRSAAESAKSPEAWLATLQIEVTAEALSAANLARAAQLLNKTNQMNLATRRLSQEELKLLAGSPNRRLWTFRVADRFGDSGITGIVSVETDNGASRIVDFVMSCRVMGRRVEEAMLHTAIEHARAQRGSKQIVAQLLPTERNRPCLEFWERSGFETRQENLFCWDLAQPYPKPEFVKLIHRGAETASAEDSPSLEAVDSLAEAQGLSGPLQR